MRRFSVWLNDRWHTPRLSPALLPLLPFAAIFAAIVFLRRLCYRVGLTGTKRLPVPVIIIGNLTVGGTGKTPLVLALAEALREKGLHPGIISRGYGGRLTQNSIHPCRVSPDSDPLDTGDEPLLLARRSGLPVWIGRCRASAGAALLAAHPKTDCLLCDDGLQHYRLARDLEIVVFDERGLGNGWMMPVGPLREPQSRLLRADLIVTHGSPELPEALRAKPCFAMRLEPGDCYRLADPSDCRPAADFQGRPLDAVAGIGNPARFFATLDNLGLAYTPHPFPDHHPYSLEDFLFDHVSRRSLAIYGGVSETVVLWSREGSPHLWRGSPNLQVGVTHKTIMMTEKDGVKCSRLNLSDAWALPVTARISPELVAHVVARIAKKTP
ncbi:MAG: tetraacyldisaccharide 4'-kinase [Betaproteobacteria bacterium]|nr:tetraacyldisaccharide 4'-kinase [Betaproteobacteria bacterium]